MAADTSTVWAAIISTLQAVDATGSYTYDISQTGRILKGAPPEDGPHLTSDPCVYVMPTGVESDANEVPLGFYRRTAIYQIVGFVPAGVDTPGTQLDAALTLGDDMAVALESTRASGQSMLGISSPAIREFVLRYGGIEGADMAETWAGYGVALGELEVMWASRSGV